MSFGLGRLRAAIAADPYRFAVRAAFVALALGAIGWDLPSSFTWENDGVAPRDIFAGVGENLRPGHAFRYPLLHPLLLGLLCLPVLVPAAAGAPSWSFADLRAAVLAPAVMTTCTLVGRLVAVAAAIVALAALGRITTRLAGRSAGRWAEAFAATNLSFSYYGRATNLDGLALMWSALAVEQLLVAARAEPGRDRRTAAVRFALFAAASIATKDQAYATYILAAPFALVIVRAGGSRGDGWARDVLRASGVFVGAYATASGALFNPTGFVTRLRTLTGPASGDYRAYERTWDGVAANLRDVLAQQSDTFWPWPIVALAWAGVALALAGALSSRRRAGGAASAGGELDIHSPATTISEATTPSPSPSIEGLLPLAAALGALGGFVLAVGRTEHRFVLAPGFWLSSYAGMAISALASAASRRFATARAARLAGVVLLAWAARPALALAATQWWDGRRDVEAWLSDVPPGTTVETYGPLVYLPRLDRLSRGSVRFTRVGLDPPAARNPLAGLREVEDLVEAAEARRPDVIVLTEGFVEPYLAAPPASGRIFPLVWQRERAGGTTRFVRAAVTGRLPGYRVGLVAEPRLPALLGPPRRVHGSTGRRTWILVRVVDVEGDGSVGSAEPGGRAGRAAPPGVRPARTDLARPGPAATPEPRLAG